MTFDLNWDAGKLALTEAAASIISAVHNEIQAQDGWTVTLADGSGKILFTIRLNKPKGE